jgi:putative sugar O-methyltransferase
VQVPDDMDLLNMMMADVKSAPAVYQPTNYWDHYEKKFMPELSREGLFDFRRREDSVLASFSGTDLSPAFEVDILRSRLWNNRYTRRIPFWLKLLRVINRGLNKALPLSTPYGATLNDVRLLSYWVARLKGEKAGAKTIEAMDTSLLGNPEDVFYVGNKPYTMQHLQYYLYYVYCCNFINFEKINTIVELGSGSGRQVEIIKKLHPHITFYLYDIPPQLYVCEQYLKSVFPGQVVSYRETKNLKTLPARGDGRIYIFGNWRFEMIHDASIDLFWNCASFQEMEPDIVSNYLSFIGKHVENVFLLEAMRGQHVAKSRGEAGVLKQTTLDDYKKGLKDFNLVDLSPLFVIPRVASDQDYSISFWKNAQKNQP